MAPPPLAGGFSAKQAGKAGCSLLCICVPLSLRVGATAPEGVFLAKHLADTHRGHVQGSIDISVQCLAAQFTCAQPMNQEAACPIDRLASLGHPFPPLPVSRRLVLRPEGNGLFSALPTTL